MNGLAVPGVIVSIGTPGSGTYGCTCTGGPPVSTDGTCPNAPLVNPSDRATPQITGATADGGGFVIVNTPWTSSIESEAHGDRHPCKRDRMFRQKPCV